MGIGQAHIAGDRMPEAIRWMRKAHIENPRAHLPVARLVCLEEPYDRSAAQRWADTLRREHPDLTTSQLARLYPDDCYDRLLRAGILR